MWALLEANDAEVVVDRPRSPLRTLRAADIDRHGRSGWRHPPVHGRHRRRRTLQLRARDPEFGGAHHALRRGPLHAATRPGGLGIPQRRWHRERQRPRYLPLGHRGFTTPLPGRALASRLADDQIRLRFRAGRRAGRDRDRAAETASLHSHSGAGQRRQATGRRGEDHIGPGLGGARRPAPARPSRPPTTWSPSTTRGWTTDGKMFDSSFARNAPSSFPLDRVIKGWGEGVQLMVVGEKRRFWIPQDDCLQRHGRPAGGHAGVRHRAARHQSRTRARRHPMSRRRPRTRSAPPPVSPTSRFAPAKAASGRPRRAT